MFEKFHLLVQMDTKLIQIETPFRVAAETAPGSGASSVKTRSETWFAVVKCRPIDGFKNRAHLFLLRKSIAERSVRPIAQQGEQTQYSRI